MAAARSFGYRGAVSEGEIRAGPHERVHCPVAVPAAAIAQDAAGAVLRVGGGERGAPLQRDGDGAWCVLPYLAAGATERVTVQPAAPGAGSGVRVNDRGTYLEVTLDGELWCRYHYAAQPVRSFLHPVIGPYGLPMTRAWPLAGVPGETTDHAHHRSFWVAHGLVNGVDCWSEADGHGFQVHGGFEELRSGPAFGRVVQRVSWRAGAAGGPTAAPALLEERRTLTFWNTPAAARLLDLTVSLHAAHGAVTFGDTKEGGLCALRLRDDLTEPRGGIISNAYGALGEAETWGGRAPWVDYSGSVTDPAGVARNVGVAIFDHPRNPFYPTHWHVRGYGLFAANPFGLADYGSGYRRRGDWTLAAGARATFRYRVLWHAGDAAAARVGERFPDWAHPPVITEPSTGPTAPRP